MTVKEFLSMISPHSKEGYIAIDNGIKNNDIYYDIKEKKFFKTLEKPQYYDPRDRESCMYSDAEIGEITISGKFITIKIKRMTVNELSYKLYNSGEKYDGCILIYNDYEPMYTRPDEPDVCIDPVIQNAKVMAYVKTEYVCHIFISLSDEEKMLMKEKKV